MAAPILVGVLRDTTGATSDEGIDAQLEASLQLAIDDARESGWIDRDVELVYERGQGLPGGTAAAVEHAFAELVSRDVLLIVGPAIGDNALVATPLADAARVPTINWSGAGHARSEWMFQLQVGSHEDEPVVLARHLADSGARRVALVYDRSPIGRRYAAYFDAECDALALDVVVRRSVSPLADDLVTDVRLLRAGDPDALVYLGLGVAGRAVGRARAAEEWNVPAFMGAAGMFGHTAGVAGDIDGWTYLDVYSDANSTLADVRARLGPQFARGPGVAFGYDVGVLLAEGLARATELTRGGVREGLELVKWIPAAEGYDGTHLTLGTQDHGALHGRYLVLRRWSGGVSVEL